MSKIETKIVSDDKKSTIIVVVPGHPVQEASDSNPNWDEIVQLAVSKNPDVERLLHLFEPIVEIAKRFDSLSERVKVAHQRVFFDGEEIDNSLTRQILRFIEEKRDFGPLVKFYEKIATNPSANSQKAIFDWVSSHDFTIDEDGDMRGYKGVHYANGKFLSSRSGKATVNNEVIEGQIPYPLGGTVEMPRSECVDNPSALCHVGLHVSTYDFAKSFADGTVLEVKINPRDVVSVPGTGNKIRVCRVKVVGRINRQRTEALVEVEGTKHQPDRPQKTQAEKTKANADKVKKIIRRGSISETLRTQYAKKPLLRNRKTGRYWFVTSKKSGVLRMLAADGSGERQNKPEASIKKSFAFEE